MPNENSAVQEFLDGLNDKSSKLLPDEKPLFSEDIQVGDDDTEDKEDAKGEKPLPFHEDPKVQKYVEKQIAKALKGIQQAPQPEQKQEQTEDELTDVLVRIIGNDTPEKQSAVKDFRKVLGSLEEKGAERALAKLQADADAQAEADREAQETLDASFEEIEETYTVDLSSNTATAKKLRSDFVDYVSKIAPKNSEGKVIVFPDMQAAFEEFQTARKPAAATRAKDLAARSLARSGDASQAPKQTDNSWKGVERLFSKLS